MREKTGILLTLMAFIFAGCATEPKEPPTPKIIRIYINQEGYMTDGEKYFMSEGGELKFALHSTSDDSVVYEGKTAIWKKADPSTGMNLTVGDFSDYKGEGEFYLKIENFKSWKFRIDDEIFNSVRDKSIKSFYYQRCGEAIKADENGNFARPACHTDPLAHHKSSQTQGEKDVQGGWHDAGDYGRYIIPASVTLGTMLTGYEQNPEKYNFDNNGIPESGNGVSDFLDEVRYEVEWMLKMQNREEGDFLGALPYMVNSTTYATAMPQSRLYPQLIYDYSSISTAAFAASMAQASRVFKEIDPKLSEKCLEGAELAWSFLEKNGLYPEGGYIRPFGTQTGGYASSAEPNSDDTDDRLWAAAELFAATGKEVYHNYVKEGLKDMTVFSGSLAWSDTLGFAHLRYALTERDNVDAALQAKVRDLFYKKCDELLNISQTDGFRTTLTPNDYFWGSNGELLMRGTLLIYGYELTGKAEYYSAALSQLNYILGLNGHNISFVTGTGTYYPEYIHHLVMKLDDTRESYPGLIPGGPNSRLDGDTTLPRYFNAGTPPALCYVDNFDSWASNENCILYNAPLVPVAAYFSK